MDVQSVRGQPDTQELLELRRLAHTPSGGSEAGDVRLKAAVREAAVAQICKVGALSGRAEGGVGS